MTRVIRVSKDVAYIIPRFWNNEMGFSMDQLESLIDKCISIKRGNKEFSLHYDPEMGFRAQIGNPSAHVWLGETEGEYRSDWRLLPQDAVQHLLTVIVL